MVSFPWFRPGHDLSRDPNPMMFAFALKRIKVSRSAAEYATHFKQHVFFFVSKELQNSGKDPKSSMVEMALASNVWTGFNQGLLERHRLLPPIASFCLLYQAVPDGSLVSPWKSLLRVTFVPKSDLGSKLCFGICRERKHMAPACRCEDAKPDAQRCERYRQRQIRIDILYK